MKISKRVPSRVKTIHYKWCKKHFIEMSQEYRKGRSYFRDPIDKCKWCGDAIQDGEMIALAQPKRGKNHVLCQKCADELLASA